MESQPTIWERSRWMRYTFFAGLVVGIVLGWVFNRLVSAAFWMVVLVLLVVGAFAIYRTWRRFTSGGSGSRAVVVIEPRHRPDERWEQ